MSIRSFYKIITPGYATTQMASNSDSLGYAASNWYTRLVRGSFNRIRKYSEYDIMDADVDVARALDLIAEEMVGNRGKNDLPLDLHLDNEFYTINNSTAATLKSALKTWCRLQKLHSRIFSIARTTIKYGDCFFLRNGNGTFKQPMFIHPKFISEASVNVNDIHEVVDWKVDLSYNDATAGYKNPLLIPVGNNNDDNKNISTVKSENIIHFSLSDDMNLDAPFGESILRTVYRTFKQKELLEDSILIYRISRAPERRVFYIATGKMRGPQKEALLQKVKNDLKQKKIPINRGGKNQIESIYDPQSMQEDFIFAQPSDGQGSRVETLPGGQGLGNLEDLQYFFAKLWRGLRIPDSYMNNMVDGGGISDSDGRVGIAYMQEIKFSQYIERLQNHLEETFDKEFKKFLADMKIIVDPTCFSIRLPSPSNFSYHRELAIDADRLNNYSNAAGIDSLSVRFAQTKYLQLTAEEQAINERLKREEVGLNVNGGKEDLVKLYNLDIAEDDGFDGSMGGGGSFIGGGGDSGGMDDIDDMDEEMDFDNEGTTEDLGGDETENEAPDEGDENEDNEERI